MLHAKILTTLQHIERVENSWIYTLSFQGDDTPELEFTKISSSDSFRIERPARYEARVLSTPRTIIPYEFGSSVLTNTTLHICRIAIKKLGHNLACPRHSLESDLHRVNRSSSYDGITDSFYFGAGLLNVKNLANMGTVHVILFF